MDVLTPVAIKSLAFATAQSVAAVVLTYMLVSGKKVSLVDKLAIFWFVYDVIVHFTLVGISRQRLLLTLLLEWVQVE